MQVNESGEAVPIANQRRCHKRTVARCNPERSGAVRSPSEVDIRLQEKDAGWRMRHHQTPLLCVRRYN